MRLAAEGHDVKSVSDLGADPGDRAVLARAARDGRVVITADRGFGELVVKERLRNAGLIVLHRINAEEHEGAVVRAIAEYAEYLSHGGFLIVTRDRIRARTLDSDA